MSNDPPNTPFQLTARTRDRWLLIHPTVARSRQLNANPFDPAFSDGGWRTNPFVLHPPSSIVKGGTDLR
jgi:hypothetical protein